MTSVPDGYPLAAAISPRVQVIATTDSTNADVVRLASESPAEWPHLSLAVTTDQRAGRGRLDRTWIDTSRHRARGIGSRPRARHPAPGSRLDPARGGRGDDPRGVGPDRRDRPQRRAEVAERCALDGGKLCGILAEVIPGQPDAVVIGAGVNTRMSRVDLPVETATSFEAVGLEVDEDRLLADFLTSLDEQLAALAVGARRRGGGRGSRRGRGAVHDGRQRRRGVAPGRDRARGSRPADRHRGAAGGDPCRRGRDRPYRPETSSTCADPGDARVSPRGVGSTRAAAGRRTMGS